MVNFIDCGRKEFINRTKGKKVYCFGAGRYLDSFINEDYGIEIAGIIDNYRFTDSVPFTINGMVIKIISLDMFHDICDVSSVIVITCYSFDDILRQLDSFEWLNGIDCYIELFIEQYTEHIEVKSFDKNSKEIIPRKIHYCWFGEKELPDECKKNIESWKKYCPNYEIIQWNETNYNIYKNTYIQQAYDNKKWAFVTDYARVDILYHIGGLYFDTDVELIKPFDEFLQWKMFCGFEKNKLVNWGIGFGSIRNEKILREILDIYENMTFIKEDGTFNMVTCPVIQSEVMKKYGFELNGEFQEKDGIAIYPKEFFSPFNYIRGFGKITDATYSIHHYMATWIDDKQEVARIELEKKVDCVRKRDIGIKEKIYKQKGSQIWECLTDYHTAGGKAPTDVKNILVKLGYHVFNIHPYKEKKDLTNWTYRRMEEEWENCSKNIEENSTLFLQYPFCQKQNKRNDILLVLKKKKHVKIIVFVHDVEILRSIYWESSAQTEFQFILQIADVMIVHNERMLEYFIQLGVDKKRLVNLQIFDYLCENPKKKRAFDKSIIIAGNLQVLKSPYIGKLQELAPLDIHLYGPNYDKEKEDISNIIYHGSFPSDQIPQRLEGGFGLVWDGNSLDTCSGPTGEYLKYNNPHKLSLYLAAGLPVIIWKEAAEATFVETYGIGFTVDSLFEVQEILDNMSEKKYTEYQNAVINISEKLLKGEYTKHAIKQAEEILQIHL